MGVHGSESVRFPNHGFPYRGCLFITTLEFRRFPGWFLWPRSQTDGEGHTVDYARFTAVHKTRNSRVRAPSGRKVGQRHIFHPIYIIRLSIKTLLKLIYTRGITRPDTFLIKSASESSHATVRPIQPSPSLTGVYKTPQSERDRALLRGPSFPRIRAKGSWFARIVSERSSSRKGRHERERASKRGEGDQSGERENRRSPDRDGYRSMASREISGNGHRSFRGGRPAQRYIIH